MKFLVLAVSYKYGGLCVAGIDYDTLNYVRLGHEVHNSSDCAALTVAEMTVNGKVLNIGDLIEVNVKKLLVNGCQTENYSLLNVVRKIKTLTIQEIKQVYRSIAHSQYIFNDSNKLISPNNINNVNVSIGFFKVNNLIITNMGYNKTKLKASFTYNNNGYCDMTVTDCVFCAYPSAYGSNAKTGSFKDAYIMVTLPYDIWSQTNGFYKYVSGIII
ncbi:MAG: hypothetical protein K2N17_03605 [Clostridia bacterium]|nr:hypothetical protein [Clostridia bacterium]